MNSIILLLFCLKNINIDKIWVRIEYGAYFDNVESM